MWVKKQQLGPYMEQLTGSKLGQEYDEVVYCHSVYVTYMQSSSGEGNGTPLQYFCLENPMTEEPGRLQSMGLLESDMTEQLHFHFSLSCTGEGNGNPLQCSCLENPRDGEAWWAAVYGIAQSRTRLKQLSSSSNWMILGTSNSAC